MTRKLILSFGLILSLTICATFTAFSQACSGHWINNRPLTFQCISGQHIGYNNNVGNPPDPPGCPINPTYTASQTNTFIFDNLANDFFIDFTAFDGSGLGCPRMQIKINDIFYTLSVSNLTELPIVTGCFGSVSNLIITADGYITTGAVESIGQGRLSFSGVNASSVTISTNDGLGTVVANPCVGSLPMRIKSFGGKTVGNCQVALEFASGIESNVRNIEIEESYDGISYSKLLELSPKGSDSRYAVHFKSSGNDFYRIKINDLDGSFAYSKIIRIDNTCASLPIRISPNPSTQKISVENVRRNDELIILDIMGRKVVRKLAMNNPTEVTIQQLPSAMYFLKIFRKNEIVQGARFIKH